MFSKFGVFPRIIKQSTSFSNQILERSLCLKHPKLQQLKQKTPDEEYNDLLLKCLNKRDYSKKSTEKTKIRKDMCKKDDNGKASSSQEKKKTLEDLEKISKQSTTRCLDRDGNGGNDGGKKKRTIEDLEKISANSKGRCVEDTFEELEKMSNNSMNRCTEAGDNAGVKSSSETSTLCSKVANEEKKKPQPSPRPSQSNNCGPSKDGKDQKKGKTIEDLEKISANSKTRCIDMDKDKAGQKSPRACRPPKEEKKKPAAPPPAKPICGVMNDKKGKERTIEDLEKISARSTTRCLDRKPSPASDKRNVDKKADASKRSASPAPKSPKREEDDFCSSPLKPCPIEKEKLPIMKSLCEPKKDDPCGPPLMKAREDKSPCPPKKEDKPACPPKKEDKPACPPKKEDKPACPPKKEDKPACPPKKEDKPACPPKKEDKPACPPKKEEKPPCPPKKEDKPACPPKKEEKPPCPPKKEEKPPFPPKKEDKPACPPKSEDKPPAKKEEKPLCPPIEPEKEDQPACPPKPPACPQKPPEKKEEKPACPPKETEKPACPPKPPACPQKKEDKPGCPSKPPPKKAENKSPCPLKLDNGAKDPCKIKEHSGMKMNALVLCVKDREVALEQVPIPNVLKKDEVSVKVKFATANITDLAIIEGKIKSCQDVVIPGRELSGVVCGAGDGVQHVKAGNTVVIAPCQPSTLCKFCTHEKYDTCVKETTGKAFGIDRDGGWAQFAVVPANLVYKVENIELDNAVLLPTMARVMCGLGKLNISPQTEILIQGCGLTGCLAALLLSHNGHERAVILESNKKKVEVIENLGVSYPLVQPEDLCNMHIDIVLSGGGPTEAIQQSLKNLAPHGSFVLFGQPGRCTSPDLKISTSELSKRSITIRGVSGTPVNPGNISAELANKILDICKLGVPIFPLKEFTNALTSLTTGDVNTIIFQIAKD